MARLTLTTEELAALSGVSAWSWYQGVRRGDTPIQPVRVGRRLVWPRAVVEQLFGPLPDSDGAEADNDQGRVK